MPGGIGIDVQDSRTAIALLESVAGQRGDLAAVAAASVGDGRRTLVPHARTATAWGSLAAEAALAELGGTGLREASLLTAWRCDGWDGQFLRGIRRRLDDYTGQAPLTASSYRLAVCADPAAVSWPAAAENLESAGLPGAALADPADALVCRWLADAGSPPADGAVLLAVACGEAYTIARSYAITRSGRGFAVTPGGSSRVDAGTGALAAALAADVLARCRPGVPAAAMLALLDGVSECAAALRARHGEAVDWSGPLAEYLFAPVQVSAPALAKRPEAAELSDFLRTEAATLSSGTRPSVVVAGGPGAVWPLARDELGKLGPVWQSLEPELDLAVGACWWPLLRGAFTVQQRAAVDRPAALFSAADLDRANRPDDEHGAGGDPNLKLDLSEVPPWER